MERIKKNVLITGASGYIGRNLRELLKNKYNFLSPKHSQLELTNSSAVNQYFRSHEIDIVINCAVVGGSRKEEEKKDDLKTNIKIFLNILNNKNYFKKMINLGSGAEYDKSRSLIKVKEKEFGQKIPKDNYGFFKYVCSKFIEPEKKIINLRIFGIFGKYEDYRYRFISNAICRNLYGLPITINKNVVFDYVYIDDLVKIIDYFINHRSKDKFYNIGMGNKINLVTIANKINLISNKKSKIIIKNSGLNNEYTCDNSRLVKQLDNFQFTDFDLSIRKLYNWYKNNIKLINKNII